MDRWGKGEGFHTNTNAQADTTRSRPDERRNTRRSDGAGMARGEVEEGSYTYTLKNVS